MNPSEYEIDENEFQRLRMQPEAEIEHEIKVLESKVNIMRKRISQLKNEQTHLDEDIRSNNEKIRLNRTLPFLVAHVIETLSLPTQGQPKAMNKSEGLISKFKSLKKPLFYL